MAISPTRVTQQGRQVLHNTDVALRVTQQGRQVLHNTDPVLRVTQLGRQVMGSDPGLHLYTSFDAAIQSPKNVAICCADTTHASATNTKAALEAWGHTVTLVDDVNITTHDFTVYDCVISLRQTDGSGSDVRAILDTDGIPVGVGHVYAGGSVGTGRDCISTEMHLTGTVELAYYSNGDGCVVTDAAHQIMAGFGLGPLDFFVGRNYLGAVDTGQSYVGDPLANGDENVPTLSSQVDTIAIEKGTDDLQGTPVATGARCVVSSLFYGGQTAYSEDGETFLAMVVGWLTQTIEPDTLTKTVSLDAAVQSVLSKALSLDAVIQQKATKALGLDAVLLSSLAKTLSLDAAIQRLGPVEQISLDAAIQSLGLTKSLSLDAALSLMGVKKTASLDAAVKIVATARASLDAALERTYTKNLGFDARVRCARDVALDAAIKLHGVTEAVLFDAAILSVLTDVISLDAAVLRVDKQKVMFDAAVKLFGIVETLSLDGAVQGNLIKVASLDGVITADLTLGVALDASVQTPTGGNYATSELDAAVQAVLTAAVSLDARVVIRGQELVSLDSAVQKTFHDELWFDALITGTLGIEITLDSAVQAVLTKTSSFDGRVDYGRHLAIDALIGGVQDRTASLDGLLAYGVTLGLDAQVEAESLTVDADLHRLEGEKGAGGSYGSKTQTEITYPRGLTED